MPMNHDQGRPSKKWYKLCFFPTIDDSSDDSDTESVVIARRTSTQTSIWEQPSPPPSPPNLESQINWLSPPLPPPPLPSLPSSPRLVLQRRSSLARLEPRINWDSDFDNSPPPSPPQPTLRPSSPLVSLQFQAANQEPQINWLSPPLPPPPLPSLPSSPPLVRRRRSSRPQASLSRLEPRINWDLDSDYSPPPSPPQPTLRPSSPLVSLQFQAANQEPQTNLQSSQPPPPPPPLNPELQINWRSPPPPPFFPSSRTLPNLEPQLNWSSSPSSSTVTTQDRPDNGKSEFLRIPDSVMNAIHMVRISELNLTDELSQCPICMEEFKLGDEACQLPCNHRYKFECLLRWLNNSETCPVCRLQLNGFEGQGSSHNIDDDDDNDSLDLEVEPQIPPQVINSLEEHLQVTEDGAGENSDEADYDSACDDLNDIWFGNYQSSHNLQI